MTDKLYASEQRIRAVISGEIVSGMTIMELLQVVQTILGDLRIIEPLDDKREE